MLLPTPLQVLHDPLFTEKRVRVLVKRDDLIHPYISGNKWRKLKYVLEHAQQENHHHLVTFGGAWSNHLLATACAAAMNGMTATGWVRGEPVHNLVLSLCTIFGMELRFVPREVYREKRLLFDKEYDGRSDVHFIDEGGAGTDAIRGCAEMVTELDEPFDHIFCACGTGTTAAGILTGMNERQLTATLHAVPVLKDQGFVEKDLARLPSGTAHWTVHPDFHLGGYAKTPPELLLFIRQLASSTGILTDPIYTGKAFFALYNLVQADYFAPGQTLVIVHTGGLTGIAGKTREFDSI